MKKEGESLGPLEREAMEYIWDQSDAVTVRDVLDRVGKKRNLAYTTVMTVMDRLEGKGLLRRKMTGNAYRYRPTMSRTEYTQGAIARILKGAKDRRSVLAAFVQSVDGAELSELRRLVREAEREREGK